jgi:MoxR-like ATPase
MTTEPNQHPAAKQYFLPAVGTWQESWYWLDGKPQDAIDLAVASGRPLLVRGLPGTGKSDLARAAAEYLGRAFVYEVITARTEPQDLLWRFDAIARLADAQARESNAGAISPLDYVSPGPLWWALNWNRAEIFLSEHQKVAAQRPNQSLMLLDRQIQQSERAAQRGTVLLLDEIDKADSELPNSLLEVLANTGFRLPWAGYEVNAAATARPLIVITTNEDRELPPAFVRRCLVLNLGPDSDFSAWIKQRARVHFRDPVQHDPRDRRPALAQEILDEAAAKLFEERENNRGDGPQPGLAEYLDLLRGLAHLAPDDPQQQASWLKRVYGFAYHKQPGSSGNPL